MEDVIILAGGLGTRLSHVVSNTQKVMAPVGGKPFLDYIFENLYRRGFRRFVTAVSYKAEQIFSHYGERYKDAEIVYSPEDKPLGTGGAIRRALGLCTGDACFVVNGDTFFDVDFASLSAKARKTGAEIVLAGKRMENFSRYGCVKFAENGMVTAFQEKQPTASGVINGGVYYIGTHLLQTVQAERFSFEKEILEPLSHPTACVPSDGYFIDIGIPEDFFRAQTEVPLLFGQKKFRAAFLDRDGVICREKHHLYKPEDFEFIDGVPEALEKLRERGYLLLVVTNQAGVAKGLYTEEDVNALHAYMCACLRDKTHIDGIYYCPFHPEGTVASYRRPSPERKPAPGMLERAAAELAARGIELDFAASVLVGDTERDILTGRNAGVGTCILVRSGHPIPDESATAADAIYNSLPAFVAAMQNDNKQQ